MDSNSGAVTLGGATSLAGQLAMLEVAADDASYQADAVVRDAARAAKQQHDQQQSQALRDKASALFDSAWVVGGLEVAAGAAQVGSACSQFSSDTATLAASDRPEGCLLKADLGREAASASRHAKCWSATSSFLGGATKASELGFSSAEANDDARAADESHAAEVAKGRADDASAALQRTQAQLDQKLSVIEDLMRSDAETMRNLIHPA
jgi:hypothetical protein